MTQYFSVGSSIANAKYQVSETKYRINCAMEKLMDLSASDVDINTHHHPPSHLLCLGSVICLPKACGASSTRSIMISGFLEPQPGLRHTAKTTEVRG